MEFTIWCHAQAEEGVPDLAPQLPEDALLLVSPALSAQQTAISLKYDFEIGYEIGPGCECKSSAGCR